MTPFKVLIRLLWLAVASHLKKTVAIPIAISGPNGMDGDSADFFAVHLSAAPLLMQQS